MDVDKPGHPTKSQKYWFEDGNIILEAQNVQFRIYRGVLTRQSTVFQDLFSLPQPADEPLVEDCPVVRMIDSSNDWENLLGVLFDSNTAFSLVEKFDLSLLSSILRLSKKYQIDDLYGKATQRLQEELPYSLYQWDMITSNGQSSPDFIDDNEIDLLNLILEFGLQSRLPVAYYICIRNLSLEEILCGTPRQDGTKARLSLDTITTLLLGRERMSSAVWVQEFGWDNITETPQTIWKPSWHCKGCESSTKAEELRSLGPDPRFALLSVESFKQFRGSKCRSCFTEGMETYAIGRKRIWEDLPSYFGLPRWEALMDQ